VDGRRDNPSLVAGIVAGSHCFLVARHAESIVAMGRAISDRVSDAYIQDVTVDPAFRGQGIGSRMVADTGKPAAGRWYQTGSDSLQKGRRIHFIDPWAFLPWPMPCPC
jgi:GNAT superfamily N-acetyltransferase